MRPTGGGKRSSRACGDSSWSVDWISTPSLFGFFFRSFLLQPWNSDEGILPESVLGDGPAVLLRVSGPVVPEGPEARGFSDQDPSVRGRGLGQNRPQRPLDPQAALVEQEPLQGHRGHGHQESHGARQDRRHRQGTRLHQGKVQGRRGTRLQDVPDHSRDLVRLQAGVQHDGHPREGEQEKRGCPAPHPLRHAQEERLHERRQQQQVDRVL